MSEATTPKTTKKPRTPKSESKKTPRKPRTPKSNISKTPKTPKKAKVKTPTRLHEAIDIAFKHLKLPMKEISKWRPISKTTKDYAKDEKSVMKQTSQLKEFISNVGMPSILSNVLPAEIFRCMRNKRIKYNDPYNISGHTELQLQKHPDKCLLWKALKYPNNGFKTMHIYVKGKTTSSSGRNRDSILEIKYIPYSNAPHRFDVVLHVSNRSSYRYSSLGKDTYYSILSIDPRNTLTQDKQSVLDSVLSIIINACKEKKDRHPTTLHITREMMIGGYYDQLQIRPCSFQFLPNEDAKW